MKVTKRILSVLLVVLMVVSSFPIAMISDMGMKVEASTNNHSRDEAVAWANNQVGKALDYDGVYGAQCVDLIKYYYVYLGNGSYAKGNAVDYKTNSIPSGWKRITVSSYSQIQPGDILVWKENYPNMTGEYGHIGIAVSVGSSSISTVEQNVGGKQSTQKLTRKIDYIYCVIRPDFIENQTATWTYNSVSGITTTNARISGRVTFSSTKKTTEAGFYIGTSSSNLTKNSKKDTGLSINYSYVDVGFTMSSYGQTLKAGTTYYYRFYVIADGKEYTSDVKSFKTTAAANTSKYNISYNANGGTGSMSGFSVSRGSNFILTKNSFSKTGYKFSGWNLKRNSDNAWYVSGQGWISESSIKANSYTKKVYADGSELTFDSSWYAYGGKEISDSESFTFYAVWEPNKLTINYNVNGGTINSTEYKSVSGIVKKINGDALGDIRAYDETSIYGLYNASTFGLSRPGYKFVGWKNSSGTIFDENDETVKPQDVNPALKNGNCSETLYAVWSHTHTVVIDNAVSATCLTAGLSQGSHCSVCSVVIIEQEPIEKISHSYTSKTTKATTSANGKIVKTCSMCGKKSTTTIAYPKTVTLSYKTKTYTGKALKPTVTVKDSNGKTISSSNYTVSYKDNTKVGKATVTITFKGNYTGKITKTFTITAKAVTDLKVTSSAKKTAKITFTKATGATGYEIYYSTKKSSNFKKLTSTAKTAFTYSKLTSGKTYYFKVRAYTKLSDGTKLYGAWSSVVSKKIK